MSSVAELTKAAGCDKGRPPSDLAWLFTQVARASSSSSEEDEDYHHHYQLLFHLHPTGTKGVSLLELQTYRQWKSFMAQQKLSHPRRLRQHTIIIQPFTSPSLPGYLLTEVAPIVLQQLQKFCTAFFSGMDIELAPLIDLTSLPNLTSRVHSSTNRCQFLVGDILKYLQRNRQRHAQCVMGVATVDLYPSPEWNFVLGHASLTSGCGIFGFGRYFSSQFSETVPTHDQQLGQLWVLIRVVSHELCHALGMKHCYYFKCAMNESNSIEEAATQPLFLCPVCLRKLKKWLGFDIFERYREMKEVISQLLVTLQSLTEDINTNAHESLPAFGKVPESEEDQEQLVIPVNGGLNPSSGSGGTQTAESNKCSLPLEFQLQQLQEASQWLDQALNSTSTTPPLLRDVT